MEVFPAAVGLITRALDHLTGVLADFEVYYNRYRAHMTLGGAARETIHRGERWQKPALCAKRVSGSIRCRFLPDTRTTAYRLAA
jgi:hypothetical protein